MMEFEEHGLLEQLLPLRRETWDNFPAEMSDLFINGGNFDFFYNLQENPSQFSQFDHPSYDGFDFGNPSNEVCYPFEGGISTSEIDPFVPTQEDCPLLGEDEEISFTADDHLHISKKQRICRVELPQESEAPSSNSCYVGRKDRAKRLDGQPSKNLMAERRRRKRLNDRLAMLRSVVPKISKMDRTSILGDTIDYMKELVERIKVLQEEIQVGPNQMNVLTGYNGVKPNEIVVRNTPKFNVERRNTDTRIEISCAAKPGLLLSTITTLEALGLDVQQCVISCFHDFGMQASCSQELEQRTMLGMEEEEIKQALFRNAGYSGRSL